MNKLLRALANVVQASYDTVDINRMAKELIRDFFPDITLPSFKIVNHTIPDWLGRSITKFKGDNVATTIEIQKSILDDEKTLHRVLAHELIHAWQDSAIDIAEHSKKMRWEKNRESHGEVFQKKAQEINKKFGKDYVTTTSDISYVETQTKSFNIIIQPHDDDRYGVTKVLRPSKAQKEEIAKRIKEQKAHIFETKDKSFSKAALIKKYGGYSLYSNQEMQKKLADIYASGKPLDAKYNSFQTIN